jgi:hypothetical protein
MSRKITFRFDRSGLVAVVSNRNSNSTTTIRFDRSALLLVLSNVFTIVVAVAEHWSLRDVIWIYWGQSVAIGYFSWLRILGLRQFSTEDVKFGDVPAEPTKATRRQVASRFLLGYGFFHAVYAIALYSELGWPSLPHRKLIAVCVGVFAASQGFSYLCILEKDLARRPKLGALAGCPFFRIIPMHLTIVFAFGLCMTLPTLVLVFFLIVKTAADLLTHMIEHREDDLPPRSPSGGGTASEKAGHGGPHEPATALGRPRPQPAPLSRA